MTEPKHSRLRTAGRAVFHFVLGAVCTLYIVVLHVLAGMGLQEATKIYQTLIQLSNVGQTNEHTSK